VTRARILERFDGSGPSNEIGTSALSAEKFAVGKYDSSTRNDLVDEVRMDFGIVCDTAVPDAADAVVGVGSVKRFGKHDAVPIAHAWNSCAWWIKGMWWSRLSLTQGLEHLIPVYL
jgi:hypothetical protein